ncbi:MAG: glycosyltransferase, partial [Pirellulaceae bacterium]|nr:glycosyltransferase [Pirellulaceae bacterium]
MHVTVGICTWNRAELLDQTLAQLRQLEIPTGVSWELLVVNNRCTDQTDEILHKHAGGLPLKRIYEERQGKSHALNTATEQARGELILWTDDDVLVDRRWLAETVAAAKANPGHSFFGGPIEPWFTQPPPQWLLDNWEFVHAAFAARQLGPEIHEFNPHRLPFGANMTVRTATQRKFLYSPKLGRVGASEVRGEETQVLRDMLA